MDTAAKTAAKAAGIADTGADPSADPSRDVELGTALRPNQNPSRVSLPLSHQRSLSIATSRQRGESTPGGRPSSLYEEPHTTQPHDGSSVGDEIPWGPAHPCFPHLNPHVPLSSPLYGSTRIVRIKRDWMIAGDLAPAFSNLYPEILDPALPEEQFRTLIRHVNTSLLESFSPWRKRAWFDAGMGLLTGWLWDDFGLTGAKRELRALETWIERWNADVGEPEGVQIIPLRRTAYLSLDVQIPDPQLEPDSITSEQRHSGVVGRGGRGNNSMSSRAPSNYSVGTSGSFRGQQQPGEREYGAYPVVPPIPGKYLEEAQQQQTQQYAPGHQTAMAR